MRTLILLWLRFKYFLLGKQHRVIYRNIRSCECAISYQTIQVYLNSNIAWKFIVVNITELQYSELLSIYGFCGQNKIVYSTRFVTRRAILLLLPRLCDKEGNNIIIARAIICDLKSAP